MLSKHPFWGMVFQDTLNTTSMIKPPGVTEDVDCSITPCYVFRQLQHALLA